jgi:hypothetical protein
MEEGDPMATKMLLLRSLRRRAARGRSQSQAVWPNHTLNPKFTGVFRSADRLDLGILFVAVRAYRQP